MQKNNKKAIVKKEKKKELMWAGAQHLMGKPATQEDRQKRNLTVLTAKALNISPFGVNLLGGIPYINQLGLKQKQEEYRKDSKIVYEWVKTSMDDIDKAVCKAKVVAKLVDLCDWIIGECSPATIKMGTLKGYQNHMAQTRARNRAIRETFGVRIHKDFMEGVEKLVRDKMVTTEEAQGLIESGGKGTSVSAEEIIPNGDTASTRPVENKTKDNGVSGLMASDSEIERIKKQAKEMGLDTIDKIEKKTGLTVRFNGMTKLQASKVLFALMSKK